MATPQISTFEQLRNYIDTNLADNNSAAIDPVDVRTALSSFVEIQSLKNDLLATNLSPENAAAWNALIAKLEQIQVGNDLGVIKTTDTMPLTGIHFGKVFEAGTYTNFKDASNASIEVSADPDLKSNFVFINVKNGVAKKETTPKPTVALKQTVDPLDTAEAVVGKGVAGYVIDIFSIRWIEGFYIGENGTDAVAPWTSLTPFIKIESERYYTLNKDTAINYLNINFYDKDFEWISKVEKQIFKTPTNAVYVKYSKETSETIKPHLLPKNNIKVSEFGDYDFKTIQQAVTYADLLGYVCNIHIIGTINLISTLEIYTNHNFIGETPLKSKIKFISNQELMKVSVSSFKNLTIERQANIEGYNVHADYAEEGVCEFDNCVIINNFGPAVGSGSHQNQTLRFKNCELRHVSGGNSFSPTLYWHNNVNNLPNQRLEIINSSVFCDYERPMQVSDQNLNLGDGFNTTSSVLVVNSIFYGDIYGKTNMLISQPSPVGTKRVAGNIKLEKLSDGNNLSVLNY